MKKILSRHETLDEVFGYLDLADYSESERKVVYEYDPADDKLLDCANERKRMSFYFHSPRTEIKEAFAEKFWIQYPESLVTDDLKKFKRRSGRKYAILDAYQMWDAEAISRIKEVFEALPAEGTSTLVVFAKEELICYNREFRWNFLGLHGYWCELEGLPRKEVVIVLNRRSEEELNRRSEEEYNGYPSFYVYAIAMHLGQDEDFQDRLHTVQKRCLDLKLEYEGFAQQIGQYIDHFINFQGTRKGNTFYYTPEIKEAVINSFYESVLEQEASAAQ